MNEFEKQSLALLTEIYQAGYFSELIDLVNADLNRIGSTSLDKYTKNENEFFQALKHELSQLEPSSNKVKQLCYHVDVPENIYHSYTHHPHQEFGFFVFHLLKRWHLKLSYRIKSR